MNFVSAVGLHEYHKMSFNSHSFIIIISVGILNLFTTVTEGKIQKYFKILSHVNCSCPFITYEIIFQVKLGLAKSLQSFHLGFLYLLDLTDHPEMKSK